MLDLDMGAYAAFVWPAWGISAVVLAALIVRTITSARRWKRELAQLESDSPQAAQGTPVVEAAAPEGRPQAARSAVGPKK